MTPAIEERVVGPDHPVSAIVAIAEADDVQEAAVIDSLRDVLETMVGRELCEWCLTLIRIPAPRRDAAEAIRMDWGATTHAFEAQGHRVTDDGLIEPALHTFEADPDAHAEYGPDDSSPTVWCGRCGRGDGVDPSKNRDKRTQHEHFENLCGALESLSIDVDVEAGNARLREVNSNQEYDDFDVLAWGLAAALS